MSVSGPTCLDTKLELKDELLESSSGAPVATATTLKPWDSYFPPSKDAETVEVTTLLVFYPPEAVFYERSSGEVESNWNLCVDVCSLGCLVGFIHKLLLNCCHGTSFLPNAPHYIALGERASGVSIHFLSATNIHPRTRGLEVRAAPLRSETE